MSRLIPLAYTTTARTVAPTAHYFEFTTRDWSKASIMVRAAPGTASTRAASGPAGTLAAPSSTRARLRDSGAASVELRAVCRNSNWLYAGTTNVQLSSVDARGDADGSTGSAAALAAALRHAVDHRLLRTVFETTMSTVARVHIHTAHRDLEFCCQQFRDAAH